MAEQANWLRFLEPSVRPTGTPAPRVQPRTTVEGRSFGELLEAAGRSPMPEAVTVSPAAQADLDRLGIALTDAELRAIGEGTDRADAKGARQALLLTDGAALTVDVAERMIRSVAGEQAMRDSAVTGIDAAAWVNPPSEDRIDRMIFR